MGGAEFLLIVNFLVAMCFSAVFAAVARHSRSRTGTLFIAAGFCIASLSAVCELLVAYTDAPKLWALGAFTTVLIGLVLLHAGVNHLYARRIDWWMAFTLVGASVMICNGIYDVPKSTRLHAFFYQMPFATVLLSAGYAILLSRSGMRIDRFLGFLLIFTGMHFIVKAELAVQFGSGTTAKDYVQTSYALISQSATAVLMVAVGLTLLAALVLGIITDQRTEAERDGLSGLPNRRAFERTVESLLTRSPGAEHALILCDVDHFKRINDSYGHLVGDQAIKSFSDLLLSHAPPHAILGRVGGEEFAIVLPHADTEAALIVAQGIRAATPTMANLPADLQVTASFGVAPLSSAAGLAQSYKKADAALYNAKNAGRNRVKFALAAND